MVCRRLILNLIKILGNSNQMAGITSTKFKAIQAQSNTPVVRGGGSVAAISIEDLRRQARKRLPRVVFDYIDGGAQDETTLRANRRAFDEIIFRPHQAVRHSQYTTTTQVLGVDLSIPVLLAPIGYARLFHPDGEIGAAAAAGVAGTIYILSTISGYSLEDVKAASSGHAWFQLYLLGGREAAEAALERAQNAGFSALVVTVDTIVGGMRERDLRNGMKQLTGNSLRAKLRFLPQLFARPSWLARFLLDGGLPRLPNVVIPGKGPMSMTDVAAALAQASVTWADLGWIRKVWKGPIVIKGVLTAEDARRSVDLGASAVIVSNHGGRQLDCVSASLHALPEVVAAVDGQAEVLMDGGIRRGGDVIKA
jgi:isopentenyl diphosphate isomerase/L-lactate dehydrogenase-like FMN-dependent dehydrogenase